MEVSVAAGVPPARSLDVELGVPPDSGGQAPRAGWCRHSSIQRKSASSKAKWSSSERSSVNPFTRVTEMSTPGKRWK